MTRWMKLSKSFEDKGLLKESKGLASLSWMMWTFHQLVIKKSNQTVLLFISLVISRLRCIVHGLQLCEKNIYAVGQNNPTTSVSWKLFWKKMGFGLSDDMVHVDFGLVTKNRQKLSTRKGNIILLRTNSSRSHLSCQSSDRRKNLELENKGRMWQYRSRCWCGYFYDLKTRPPQRLWLRPRSHGIPFEKEKLAPTFNMLTLVSNPSFVKQTYTIYRRDTQLERPRKLGNHQASPRLSLVFKRAAENYDQILDRKICYQLGSAFNKYYAHTRILDESPEREKPSCS